MPLSFTSRNVQPSTLPTKHVLMFQSFYDNVQRRNVITFHFHIKISIKPIGIYYIVPFNEKVSHFLQLVGLRFNLMLIWTFISRFISGVQGPTSPLQQCNKRSMIDSSRKEITFLKISRKEITFLEISCKKGSKF